MESLCRQNFETFSKLEKISDRSMKLNNWNTKTLLRECGRCKQQKLLSTNPTFQIGPTKETNRKNPVGIPPGVKAKRSATKWAETSPSRRSNSHSVVKRANGWPWRSIVNFRTSTTNLLTNLWLNSSSSSVSRAPSCLFFFCRWLRRQSAHHFLIDLSRRHGRIG